MYCGKGSRTKEHICEICSEAFSSKIFLKIHKRKSHSLNAKCSACEKNVRNLERHTKLYCRKITRSNKKEYSCELCVKLFSSKKLLRIHTNKDHLSKMKCRHCKIPVSTEEHDAHLLSCCIEGNVKCEYCEMDFNCSTTLFRHQSRIHGKRRSIEEFTCDICLETFATMRYVTEHKKLIHEGIKEHSCDLCEKLFSTKKSLKIHKIAIHEFLSIPCGNCGKQFKTQKDLRRHVREIHENKKKWYKCDICESSYPRPNHLSKHVKLKHINDSSMKTQNKIFPCKFCGKTFNNQALLLSM